MKSGVYSGRRSTSVKKRCPVIASRDRIEALREPDDAILLRDSGCVPYRARSGCP